MLEVVVILPLISKIVLKYYLKDRSVADRVRPIAIRLPFTYNIFFFTTFFAAIGRDLRLNYAQKRAHIFT